MGGAEQVVVALAVLEPEDAVAVLGPAAGGLVGLAGQQRGEQQLLGADRVHLVADDVLDLAQHPQAQRQPGVDAGRGAADVAGAHEEPVARHLGVRGVLAQGADEQAGHTQDHGREGYLCDGVARTRVNLPDSSRGEDPMRRLLTTTTALFATAALLLARRAANAGVVGHHRRSSRGPSRADRTSSARTSAARRSSTATSR